MAVDYESNQCRNRECKIDKNEDEEDEEDYIDMEVSSFAKITALSSSSPQHPREFEFHMSSYNVERDSTTSPADELFYKGKLLPLHLPPRLQMVEKLLQDPPCSSHFNKFNETYGTPLGTNTVNTPAQSSTPFESCNISPVESCQVSRELNVEEYFGVCGVGIEEKGIISINVKKSWTKKLKFKIKSLFGKSGCADESRPDATAADDTERIIGEQSSSLKGKEIHVSNKKKATFGHIASIVVPREIFGKDNNEGNNNNNNKDGNVCHRRSFSGAFKRRSSTTKLSNSSSSGSSSSSSSSSSNTTTSGSNCLSDLQALKRSNSSSSEIETSLIQGAIAHCKKSQEIIRSRKTLSEVGSHSFPSRFSAFDDQTSATGHCRG